MHDVLSWSESVLKTTPTRWITLTETLPAELLGRAPAAGEWSALDCLGHLVETERWVFPVRVVCFLESRDFDAFDPDAAGSHAEAPPDAAALAREFEGMRHESLRLFHRLTTADLERTARHPELGRVTLGELIHEWAGHDLMHTVQAERAMMQPFIQGCGPWTSYFSDHVAAKEPRKRS
jgi:hypothetical protein